MPIFKAEDDYLFFIECINCIKEKHPFIVHSICLMTNHFHMIIESMDVELWKIMQKLLSIYAEQFNHRHAYTGHLFEGRYTACLIEDDIYFLEVSRYIHLNPVKAQMVREPIAYEYSSYSKFVTEPGYNVFSGRRSKVTEAINELVDTDKVLSAFGHNPREQYRMFVEGKISHAEQEMLIQKDIKEDDMWMPW